MLYTLCFILCTLCPMPYALCPMLYALHPTVRIICKNRRTTLTVYIGVKLILYDHNQLLTRISLFKYASMRVAIPTSMLYALCSMLYTLHYILYALCSMLYTLHSILCSLGSTERVINKSVRDKQPKKKWDSVKKKIIVDPTCSEHPVYCFSLNYEHKDA